MTSPGSAIWVVGNVFMTLVALMNFATAIINYFWTCFGMSEFGFEMDVVYGVMFFTYPGVPFSKIEGTCALLLAIGGFMCWAEDPEVQFIALILSVFGSGYWIVCTMYGILVKDMFLTIMSLVIVVIVLGTAFSRANDYVLKAKDNLTGPFYIIVSLVLVFSLAVSVAGAYVFDDEKKEMVARLRRIQKYNKETEPKPHWPVENACAPTGCPDGFEEWDKKSNA